MLWVSPAEISRVGEAFKVLTKIIQQRNKIHKCFLTKTCCFSLFLSFLFIAGDFYFMKSLSRAGIYTIIQKYDTNINIRRFLSTDAWSLGVVVDLRCNNKSAVTIFAEVKEFIKLIFKSFLPIFPICKEEERKKGLIFHLSDFKVPHVRLFISLVGPWIEAEQQRAVSK